MSKTFIIAEAACTWLHAGLEGAYRSIKAAKECGASAWKTQWTSDPEAMAMRRGVARDKYTRLGWSGDALPKLKEECDRVGIEFMCTVFLPKDIPLIAPYVDRFKISAFESRDAEFIKAHEAFLPKRVVLSINHDRVPAATYIGESMICVSEYPTALEKLKLHALRFYADGLSDHTTSTLTGAVAVGAGARLLEKHVRLSDTPADDPDYGHSLVVDYWAPNLMPFAFKTYVDNVRETERML